MGAASALFTMLSASLTLLGLIPCLGWANWVAVPTSLACALVGLIGLATDRDPRDGSVQSLGLHVAAILVGVCAAGVGLLRGLLGGGIL
jgi:hypothetical protein